MKPSPNSPEVAVAFDRYVTATCDGPHEAMAAAIEAYLTACLASDRGRGAFAWSNNDDSWASHTKHIAAAVSFPVIILRTDGGSDE